MAIMVAGGLTFAIPGMEPAYAAQIDSNPNLRVSAEGQNADNKIGVTNIVQVLVIDDLNNEVGDAPPIITVDGDTIVPYQTGSGAWYLYFADDDIIDAGLGLDDACTVAAGECTEAFGEAAGDLIASAPVAAATGAVAGNADQRTLHLLELDGEFDVIYGSPNGDQTVTLEADDPDVGVSLDRSNYPQNTDVIITIDDQALNVDPTSEDAWYFGDNGASAYADLPNLTVYLNAVTVRQNAYNTAEDLKATNTPTDPRIEGATLLGTIKTNQGLADEVITNPISDETRVTTLIGLHGQGDRTVDTPDTDPNYKGSLQIAHEELYGRGTMTVSTPVTDPNYTGSLLATYEAAAGRGDANVPSTVAFDADATFAQADDANFIGSAQYTYLRDIAIADNTFERGTSAAAVPGTSVTDVDAFGLDKGPTNNEILECADDDCVVIDGVTWVKFTETDSNESTFNNAPSDESSMKTTDTAQRGLSFSVTYDDTTTSGIEYTTTNIVIDAGDEWNSGEEIGITLTDSDANTNSLDANDLSVANPDQMLPIIEFGEPFTLLGIDDITVTDPTNDAEDPININARTTEAITATDDDTNSRLILGGNIDAVAHNLLIIDLGTAADVGINTGANSGETHVANFDVNSLGDDAVAKINFGDTVSSATITELGAGSGNAVLDTSDVSADTEVRLVIHILTATEIDDSPIVFDIFSFGLEDKTDPTSNTNDAIYRLELEEDGDNSSDFIGTLEYIGLNQYNILNPATYGNIDALGDSIILISDDDSISVEYRDLDSTGGYSTFTAGADTPTHSGSVSLDSDGYKVADTVLVTVEDADLNVDSGKADVYTVYEDKINSANSVMELFSVSIDSNDWDDRCGDAYGLEETKFTLRETGNDSGVFTGTFSVPAEYCADSNSEATTVTGADISVEYVDFRDDSGSIITVSASAGIRSTTGSVSLDRTVYPVPFGAETFATSNGGFLPEGKLTVYVSIEDSDFDQSANGVDKIEIDGDAPLTVSVIRGSDSELVGFGGNMTNAIDETAPDSGVFEFEIELAHGMGPVSDNKCPARDSKCVLQGDILHVTYNDPSDASGSANTVTDSATFDLRNGVLQSDQTAYIIGSDMIVTMIEPDLNLDNDSVETYDLDLIEWDSDAGTAPLGDKNEFDATPSNLLETGADTGIFQVVVGIPVDVRDDRLERGEEITLTYIDHGPSGADYVGDKDEEVTTTVYTSNFGATIELDQRVYTWTDKVYITVVAPDHNIDSDQVDEIGNEPDYPIRVSTRGDELDNYKLVETGADTGIFTGEVILVGFDHDADGEPGFDNRGETGGTGPTDGMIETESESGISVSFKYSDGETVSSSALIRWNVGEVQWLEASYPASGSGIVRVIDPDMNLNPEAVDNFDIIVWSDSDGGGIDLTVTETNAATGIFEGTVFFGVGVDTSGHRLRVVEGDTVTAQYYDNTLPAPFKETERVRVGATTLIGTVVPPLERVPISDLRAVDSFGNTLDAISVDSQIQLESDLTNNQDKAQEFAYLIQIQNESGVTVSLNWITGSLTEGQSLSPATSWTPDEAGTYEVTAFVWESIENPTALSPTATIAITVN